VRRTWLPLLAVIAMSAALAACGRKTEPIEIAAAPTEASPTVLESPSSSPSPSPSPSVKPSPSRKPTPKPTKTYT